MENIAIEATTQEELNELMEYYGKVPYSLNFYVCNIIRPDETCNLGYDFHCNENYVKATYDCNIITFKKWKENIEFKIPEKWYVDSCLKAREYFTNPLYNKDDIKDYISQPARNLDSNYLQGYFVNVPYEEKMYGPYHHSDSVPLNYTYITYEQFNNIVQQCGDGFNCK
jgi:hypothetical protein